MRPSQGSVEVSVSKGERWVVMLVELVKYTTPMHHLGSKMEFSIRYFLEKVRAFFIIFNVFV